MGQSVLVAVPCSSLEVGTIWPPAGLWTSAVCDQFLELKIDPCGERIFDLIPQFNGF